MRSGTARGRLVGRAAELGRLRDALVAVGNGRGGLAVVSGEPGIGKSTLLATAFADAPEQGCHLLRGVADELSQRFPLRVLLECLPADTRHPDGIASRLPAEPPGDDDAVPGAVELVLFVIDQLCAESPVVLVVDDLQWADEASLRVWLRLARLVQQLPLLLVGSFGPVPPRAELAELRRVVRDNDGLLIDVAPLPEASVIELLTDLVGAPPAEELTRLAGQAAGNPLYLRELIEAMLREKAVEIHDGRAELTRAGFGPPGSLAAAVERRLELLSAEAVETFRWAALLGQEFTVDDLAVVARRSPDELAGVVANAIATGVVAEAGQRLRFRHPLTRAALREGIPQAMRTALHRQAAQALAETGATPERVAEQLLLAPAAPDRWVVGWLPDAAEDLARRAPLIAVELLERAIAHIGYDDRAREALTAKLAIVLFRLGRTRDTEARARQALAYIRDPALTAQMRWILGYVVLRDGRISDALETVEHALTDPEVPPVWNARLQALRSLVLANAWADPDATVAAAAQAIELGENTGDRYAVGQALRSLFYVHVARRDYASALSGVDRALGVLQDDPRYSDLRTALLDHRVFILQNLDRLDDAEATLRKVRELADRAEDAYRSRMRIAAGIHNYWVGRWDDSLAEFAAAAEDVSEATVFGLQARWTVLLLHGGAALIAGHRDDRAASAAHLRAGFELGIHSPSERDNCDFLLAAEALIAERNGEPERALAVYAPVLDPEFGHTLLRHQWLPDIVRLALEVADATTARAALAMCEVEAARESTPARATAALARCRGLVDGDATAVRRAADHYRAVGRPVELAYALEDAAVLHARQGEAAAARCCLDEAIELYTRLRAGWDIRRAETRLRRYGVRRGVGGPRRRAGAGAGGGWTALTATELRVARLVAEGRSNPEIAAELFLSRRTVQTHVQHILTKLDVHSRVEIARQAIAADTGN
ncbi:MAG TPA: AAA family ATPase [Pilimelia sp.]|nr:AAA family ATPase [Pilimelia sp.]